MSAYVSKTQSVINATNFIENYSAIAGNYLYLGISKADPWNDTLTSTEDGTPASANDSETMQNLFRDGLIAVKRVLESQFCKVVPRIDWQSGTAYDAWDDQEPAFFDTELEQPNFYALTSALALYKCLRSGTSVSSVQPNHTTTEPQIYADGYVWHYLYTLLPADAVSFLNTSFCPIRNSSSAGHITHEGNCKTALDGGIFRVIVTNGGSGYLVAPTVTVEGLGTGALATATIVGGIVTKIEINANGAALHHGTGYKSARIVIGAPPEGGTQAVARAVLSPQNGHGTNIETELSAYNVEIAVDLSIDENGTFITDNDYRQIGLIRNLTEFGDPPETFAAGTSYNALAKMTLSGVAGGDFASDDVVRQTNGTNITARCYVDQVDTGSPYTIWYHQNYKTGWTSFETGQTVANGNGSGAVSGIIASKVDPEIEPYSGELIFIENRDLIQRSPTSREELRIIIQF
jgi:hypothetical protein